MTVYLVMLTDETGCEYVSAVFARRLDADNTLALSARPSRVVAWIVR